MIQQAYGKSACNPGRTRARFSALLANVSTPLQITAIADDIAEVHRADPPAVASARAAGGAEAAAELAESLSTAENGVQALLRHADAAAATLVRRRALQVGLGEGGVGGVGESGMGWMCARACSGRRLDFGFNPSVLISKFDSASAIQWLSLLG